MKSLMAAFWVSVLVFAVPRSSFGTLVQSFDQNASNWQVWTVNNGGGQNLSSPTYHAQGGNSGGYISTQVDNTSNRFWDFQPGDGTIFGDMTGQNLSVDFKIDGSVTNPDSPKVRFFIGSYTGGNNYFVSNDTYSWNPNLDTTWVTHQVQLITANFVRWPNGDANSKTFEQVIASPNDIGMIFTGNVNHFNNNSYLGFSSACGATISVDNFGTVAQSSVPEPATLSLLTLGYVGIIRRKG